MGARGKLKLVSVPVDTRGTAAANVQPSALVMDHLDEFGGLPSIEIKPVYLADDDGFPFSHFDVVIAGVQ